MFRYMIISIYDNYLEKERKKEIKRMRIDDRIAWCAIRTHGASVNSLATRCIFSSMRKKPTLRVLTKLRSLGGFFFSLATRIRSIEPIMFEV